MSNVIDKAITEWTEADLLDWAAAETVLGDSVTEEEVISLAKELMGVDAAIVEADDVKLAILDIEEAKTQAAAEALATKEAEEQAAAEAVAAAAKEQAEKEAAIADQAEQTTNGVVDTGEPFNLNGNVQNESNGPLVVPTGESAVEVRKRITEAQLTLGMKLLEEGIAEYAAAMAPRKPVNDKDGRMYQVKLWRIIQGVLRSPAKEFTKNYSRLLSLVNEHRDGVFSDRYIYRWMPELTLPGNDKKNFERILNLLVATADPATRAQGLKQVDLKLIVNGLKDGEHQQRLLEYYKV